MTPPIESPYSVDPENVELRCLLRLKYGIDLKYLYLWTTLFPLAPYYVIPWTPVRDLWKARFTYRTFGFRNLNSANSYWPYEFTIKFTGDEQSFNLFAIKRSPVARFATSLLKHIPIMIGCDVY